MTEQLPAVVRPPTKLTYDNSLSVATMPGSELEFWELPVPSDTEIIHGALLGHASSHRVRHSVHRQNRNFAPKGDKCPACRWFEARIFRLHSHVRATYAVHTLGMTIVPGEFTKCRLALARTGYEVVELLTVRRDDAAFLPAAASRALSQAAGLDDGIETAYVNRAV
jgi:hypothetical protein